MRRGSVPGTSIRDRAGTGGSERSNRCRFTHHSSQSRQEARLVEHKEKQVERNESHHDDQQMPARTRELRAQGTNRSAERTSQEGMCQGFGRKCIPELRARYGQAKNNEQTPGGHRGHTFRDHSWTILLCPCSENVSWTSSQRDRKAQEGRPAVSSRPPRNERELTDVCLQS